MKHNAIAAAFAVAAFAVPQVAEAAWGHAMTDLNVRACAGVQCAPIGVLPGGSQVWVGGSVGGWYQVSFNGMTGYASARYISVGYAQAPTYTPRLTVVRPPPRYARMARPSYGFYQQPWWDQRYGAWYDGRRWFSNGQWYDRPNGFSLGFRFGG